MIANHGGQQVFIIGRPPRFFLNFYGLDFISDLNGEGHVRTFYKKELQKTIQKEFRVEKVIKRNVLKNMLNGKAAIVLLTVRLTKKA